MNRDSDLGGDILVVDDNPANLRLLTDMLSQRGYTVRVASSGEQTLKTTTMRPPELILLDIRMPGMDGFEVCEKLKQAAVTSAIPIIFLSALSDIEDKVRAFALGGVDFITKPFQAEEVLMRVSNQIGISRSRQALQQAYDQMEQRAEARSRELIAAREEQLRVTEQLKNALEQTINVIVAALEKRDPYTAGHQRNVAELSLMLAERLGFDSHAIEGVRLGAMIHDIGKIGVPAEILTRPGRLSEIEFNLIKTHPEVGYDIVKGVELPWPVALMVRQHHERLDGSGYPLGLKDDEINYQAKIIAVADVIDAMSSHRPYRPALGIESAIQEIDKHKGLLYESVVVEAAIDLFREGRMDWLNHGRPKLN